MTELDSYSGQSPFEAIRRLDARGAGEHWSARDLQPPLGYDTWRRFEDVIDRAKAACANSGRDVTSHFADAVKDPLPGQPGSASADYRLSRYACYLIAMNGDPRKPAIAAAQTYFAVKTREAELAQAAIPRSFAEALELAAVQQREIERAQAKVAELEPQAEQYRKWQISPDTVHVVEWAKTIGLTQREAYEALRELGVLFKQQHEGVAFNVPKRGYEQYFDMVDEWLPGPRRWVKVSKITAEGQVVLAELLLEKGWIAG